MSTCKIATIPLAASVGTLAVPILIGGAAAIVTTSAVANLAQAHKNALLSAEHARMEQLRREQQQKRREQAEAEHAAGSKMAHLRQLEQAAATALTQGRVQTRATPAPGDEPPEEQAALEKAGKGLAAMRQLLEEMPSFALKDARLPFSRLLTRVREMEQETGKGDIPDPEDLLALQQTLQRSLARHAEALAQESETAPADFLQKLEELHGKALSLELASQDSEKRQRAQKLARESLELAAATLPGEKQEHVLQRLTQAVQTLYEEVENELTWREFRKTLTGSVQRQMIDMGYELLDAFAQSQDGSLTGTFRMAGGERIQALVEDDGRMVFNLMHERLETGASLSSEEIAFYRQQEAKWSLDFQELLRRLTKEGFSYGMQLEQSLAADAIPVVVVETAQDIAAATTEEQQLQDEKERRARTQKQQRSRSR